MFRRPLDRYPFCPEYRMQHRWPPRLISIRSLDQCIPQRPVRSLDEPVRLGVVGGDPYIVNPVFPPQFVQSLDKRTAIVRYNFFNRSPPTENLLEDEGGYRLPSLSSQGTAFRVPG